MRVAIPVDDNTNETKVCMSFGRAPYYAIFDTETQEMKYVDNSAAASQGGAGIKASQTIIDEGAEAVITPRCGQNAADVLLEADIRIYRSNGDSVRENVEAYVNGRLSLLEQIHPGLHQHGAK